MLSEPRCAKCDYDLRGFSGTAPVRCSECGADLTARHAILWGKHPPMRGRVWIGIAIFLSPFLLLPLLLLTMKHVVVGRMSANSPGSPGFAARSNAQVIASLATSVNTPWDWQELERRFAAGKLSNVEVGQAIDKLIAFLNTQPTSQPITWAEQFLTITDAAGKITSSQYERLGKAYYKPCTVSIASTMRAGAKLPVTVHGGGPWRLPDCEYVYCLRQVSISGQPDLEVKSDESPRSSKPNADYLSAKPPQEINGAMRMKVAPGKYVLVCTIDVAMLKANTAPLAVMGRPGQAAGWPKGRAAWTEVVNVPVNVVPADQSPIALVTDPIVDPNRTGAVHVNQIRVIREGDGQRVTTDITIDGGVVPCSFDVTLRIDGKSYPTGWCVAANDRSRISLGCHVDGMNPSIQTADVLLRPNPVHAEGRPDIDRVWDGPMDFPNVPLERYDVQGK